MRDDNQVNNEIARLTVVLKRWELSREVRERLHTQVIVLGLRLDIEQVERRYPGDLEVVRAARWLNEEEGVKRPSTGLV